MTCDKRETKNERTGLYAGDTAIIIFQLKQYYCQIKYTNSP
jgi:hypothetical protein